MKKHNDQDLHGSTLALLDRRSEAFKQKMLKHFQSKRPAALDLYRLLPGTEEKQPGYILEGKPLTPQAISRRQPLCISAG